jgi:hypothetical protein
MGQFGETVGLSHPAALRMATGWPMLVVLAGW